MKKTNKQKETRARGKGQREDDFFHGSIHHPRPQNWEVAVESPAKINVHHILAMHMYLRSQIEQKRDSGLRQGVSGSPRV